MGAESDQSALVARLRLNANFAPYDATSAAPAWVDGLARLVRNDLGALALLGPAGLTLKDTSGGKSRPQFDPATLYLVALADRLRRSHRRIAIGLPPAAKHLPLLFAASAVLAGTVEDLPRTGDRGAGILLISPDLDLRSRYSALHVGAEPLDLVHPGSRMRPDGTRVRLNARNQRAGGVCFFLPHLALPSSIDFNPSLIVLDLRYSRWSKRSAALSAWAANISASAGVLAVYTLGDVDTSASLRTAKYIDFPMDHGAVKTCQERVLKPRAAKPLSAIDWNLEPVNAYLARAHEIKQVPGPSSAETVLAQIAEFNQQFGNRDAPDLRRARWLLAVLQQLPVPLPWYEEAARALGRLTIRRMISYLGARNRFDVDLGPAIQTLRMYFDEAYSLIGKANPRADLLRKVLTDPSLGPRSAERALLLTRDDVMERAVRSWIEIGEPILLPVKDQIEVCGCPRYAALAQQRFDLAIVNGAFPRRYAWIAGAALADRVLFLTYQMESDLVVRQLGDAYDAARRTARAHSRAVTVETVAPKSHAHREPGTESAAAELSLVRPIPIATPEESHRPRTIATGLSDLKAALQAAQDEDSSRRPPGPAAIEWPEDTVDEDTAVADLDDLSAIGDADDIESIRVQVTSRARGLGYIWLPISAVVEFVRPGSKDVLRVIPSELRPRDVLLRMDDGRRSSIFDRIVELAEDQPELQYLAAYRATWRAALLRIAGTYPDGHRVDYSRILVDLQRAGAVIESEVAVRGWVSDWVIGPEKQSSIVAVGRISGSDPLVTRAKEFDAAFRRIRGIHQGIGRRLSSAIRKSFQHKQVGGRADPDNLDDSLGLPLDELLDSIDLAEVIAVDQTVRRVPAPFTDRFRTTD